MNELQGWIIIIILTLIWFSIPSGHDDLFPVVDLLDAIYQELR